MKKNESTDLRLVWTPFAKYRDGSPDFIFLAYALTFIVSIKWNAVLWNDSIAT